MGGIFNSSRIRTSKPERIPAKQEMVHGRISDPGAKWGSEQKRAHCRSSVIVTGPTPLSPQEGRELEGLREPGFPPMTSQRPGPQKLAEFSLAMGGICE